MSKHTRGPLLIANGLVTGVDSDGTPSFDIFDSNDWPGDTETGFANARLIAAAYTSYDKHCGDRAIECAEGDLLGELLEAAIEARKFLRSIGYHTGGLDAAIEKATVHSKGNHESD